MRVFGCAVLLCLVLIIATALAAPSEKKEVKLEEKEVKKEEEKEEVKLEEKEVKKEEEKEEAKPTEEAEKSDKEICGECDTKKCPKVTKCLAGLVRDRCGCCDVCGLEQDQLCNIDGDQLVANTWYGRCGLELECRQRNDVDTQRVGNQSVCFCVREGGVLCGTDQKTYDSFCKLQAAVIESDGKLALESHGPCKTKPTINKIAQNKEVKEKADVSLRCETQAYPLPHFQWTFTRPNGVVKILPSDDTDVSISTRGGPGSYQVTSHLLITNIQLRHEGTYGCIVSNEVGMDQMLARIVVSTPEEKEEM